MNRPIEVRGWDCENKKMLESQDLSVNSVYWKWLGKYDHILMQWTGLLDKNGVKIFEGDIVVSDGYPWFDDDKPNYRDTVEWCFAGFHAVHHCVNKTKQGISDGINTTLEDGAEWEVIGNIFESPELLQNVL